MVSPGGPQAGDAASADSAVAHDTPTRVSARAPEPADAATAATGAGQAGETVVSARPRISRPSSRRRLMLLIAFPVLVIVAIVVVVLQVSSGQSAAFKRLVAGVPANVRGSCQEHGGQPFSAGALTTAVCTVPGGARVTYYLFPSPDAATSTVDAQRAAHPDACTLPAGFSVGDAYCAVVGAGNQQEIFWSPTGSSMMGDFKGDAATWLNIASSS